MTKVVGQEALRLSEDVTRKANWKRWGPYLSERQWATVREDYSPHGTCWDYFPHDHARSRAYRWGEDGLLGFTDRQCRLCFALSLWNGVDPILKERLYGLTNEEGSHGEDAKEVWFYLDSTPTHSYAKALYKYPQGAFPYERLIRENRGRAKNLTEFELADTGVFDGNRYFDVFAEYAKAAPEDVVIRITVINRGPEKAPLHLLPTLWFRNTWSWGCTHEGCSTRPRIRALGTTSVVTQHESLQDFQLEFGDYSGVQPRLLFTENDTNLERLHGVPNETPYVKDAFHRYLIEGASGAINPNGIGSKVAAYYPLELRAGSSAVIYLRLHPSTGKGNAPRDNFSSICNEILELRKEEADEFYLTHFPDPMTSEERNVARQACAGLLWSKQFYHYVVEDWLVGDPGQPPPPKSRLEPSGRNVQWPHLYARDVLSMPDKWEYPWFAAWDSAFHMLPFACLDGDFAKRQLELFLREWYMHPNGQIPAYEFAFGDVNPPVHAWAAWRVYKLTARQGQRDRDFLEGVFQKLLLNFTWWVNRKDSAGRNLFSGGFLGLDNVGVFDRSKPLPGGGELQQADGTAWMAFYCATMLAMALELAHDGQRLHPAYEDMASKFLEHFVQISEAMNTLGGQGLWCNVDGFYYDQLLNDGQVTPLRTRSIVGLLPLIAVEVFEEADIARLPGFQKRLAWFTKYKHGLGTGLAIGRSVSRKRLLLAIPTRERLRRLLRYLGDESEFLSPYGLRSLSKHYEKNPYRITLGGHEFRIDYVPGESSTWLFGGNSNWRGPIWFPVNYLIEEALERYHHFYGDEFTVEYPHGTGVQRTLLEIAHDLERRLSSLFLKDSNGSIPSMQELARFRSDPHWKDLLWFHEYFHSETGRGCGANHQTGWTALVVRFLMDQAKHRKRRS